MTKIMFLLTKTMTPRLCQPKLDSTKKQNVLTKHYKAKKDILDTIQIKGG